MVLSTSERRRRRSIALLGWILLALSSSGAITAGESASRAEETEAAIESLLESHPTLRIERDLLGRTLLLGAPMPVAEDSFEDPDAAVDAWLAAYADALSIDSDALELLSISPLTDGRATVYAYRPRFRGIEIEGGAVRLLVRPTQLGQQVTYAAAHTALVPPSGYPQVMVAAAQAATIARAEFREADLEWRPPRLVISPSATTRTESVLAWHVIAERGPSSIPGGREIPGGRDDPGVWTVRIDPATGALLEVRDERLGIDVTGSVHGFVTPAPLPDLPTNPSVEVPLPRLEVSIAGGASTFTGADGSFTIPHPGSDPVSLEASLLGEWVAIEDLAGPLFFLSTTITPPAAGTLLFDPLGSELLQAQLNGFQFATRSHDFIRDRTPFGIPGIDVAIPCRVNLNDTCNASFDPVNDRINFFLAGDGCTNSAFSNVITHEYGHFVVDQLALGQGAFGEGFGDVLAMLIEDDPLIGREFEGPGTWVRDPIDADVQYPCVGETHHCGQLLGAVWWKIRENFGLALGDAAGLEAARQLMVDWAQLTIGGIGDSSAHPQTALEILAVDDDDATLENGTPRFMSICAAFAEHSIDCPPLPPVSFVYPDGRPTEILADTATELRVDIVDGTSTIDPATATLLVRFDGAASFSAIPLTGLGGDAFTALIPPQPCGSLIEYAVTVLDTGGQAFASPLGGENEPFTAAVFESFGVAFADDFETDTGWSVGSPLDTASSGIWERVIPIGTSAAPSSDHSAAGEFCFVTGAGIPGGGLGADDVDSGPTTLTSPLLDLGDGASYEISYWRWYSNDTGSLPNSDVFTVDLSDDDGATWVNVETVGPGGVETSGEWYFHAFVVESLLPPSSAMRVRFIASDTAGASLVEAAVDDFSISRRVCPLPQSFLRGDTNGDLGRNLSDAVALLVYLFAGGPLLCHDAGDANDSGTLTLSDVIMLLQHLFSGGGPLLEPFDTCGIDPTTDALDCATGPSCP